MRVHGQNIRQQNPDIAGQAQWDVFIKQEVLRKHGGKLTGAEKRLLRGKIAADFFDWGYAAARQGETAAALAKYWRSFRCKPSCRALWAMPKALLHGIILARQSLRGG